ncbi:MAG: amidohydrolase [Oscillospiraceae bacterium]|nr:amidohydrolase [Oscillospiraceae bacterium]
MNELLHKKVQDAAQTLVADRRWLHSHAEISFQEKETTAWLCAQLEKIDGLTVSRPTATGAVATLSTGRPGPVVAFRADIDALAMTEATGLPYASQNPGAMHACGHDGHAAVLLSAARLLAGMRDELRGEVRFLFQHAEEVPPGGAAQLVAAGAVDGVEEVYGLHFTSSMPTGSFGVRSGVLTSATDRFDITVKGKGGHSAIPQECVDPVVIGAQIVLALQGIISRKLNPCEVAVLSICQVSGGSAYNIIPHTIQLTGSVRTFDQTVRENVERWIEEIARGIAQAQGGDIDFAYSYGYGFVVNDPALTEAAAAVIRETFGPQAVVPIGPQMPGEDFCHFLEKCPGFFVEVGAASPEKGITAPHHNPLYQLDEDALPLAAEYAAALLASRLKR